MSKLNSTEDRVGRSYSQQTVFERFANIETSLFNLYTIKRSALARLACSHHRERYVDLRLPQEVVSTNSAYERRLNRQLENTSELELKDFASLVQTG